MNPAVRVFYLTKYLPFVEEIKEVYYDAADDVMLVTF